jgi:succinyl-CoA--D-citramalate CoA-transferase
MTDGPLTGVKVLELGTMIAGPFAATLLADFGAEVIKVERPGAGDPLRAWTPQHREESLWWKVTGRNKRLITLNLATAEGLRIVRRLVEWADVLVENFRPGTLEKWGLDPAELERINPKLVVVRISGYGQTGPYRNRPGFGTIAEAMSGIPFFTGFPEGPPTFSAFPLADSVAGVFAAMAAAFAIRERDQGSGRGQVVDVSLYEPLFRLIESQVIGYEQLGIVKQRRGNRMEEDSPRNVYSTSDGNWISISASSQPTFERLALAIGHPEFLEDSRFSNNARRVEHADELDAVIAAWFADRTAADALQVLNQHDVVAGPVYDIRAIFSDPHYQAREDIVAVRDPETGQTYRMQNVVPKFSRTPGRVNHPGLAMGSHNRDVYCDLLGFSESELKHLQMRGVI